MAQTGQQTQGGNKKDLQIDSLKRRYKYMVSFHLH